MIRIFTQLILHSIGIFFLFFTQIGHGQTLSLAMDIEFKDLPHTMVGGLSNPQFSEADLNNDGTLDLIVFERAESLFFTFINNGTPNTIDYQYAPQYESNFPTIAGWAITADYNCDGVMDLFTSSVMPGVGGISVFEGSYNSEDEIIFNLVSFGAWDVIPFQSNGNLTNLYVSEQDIPAVCDMDNDGDLDVLTFAIGGGFIQYYKNRAIESTLGCTLANFVLEDGCWGGVYESGLSKPLELSPTPDSCYQPFTSDPVVQVRHAGSTLLLIDKDADGDKDLYLGDLAFANINLLTNGGTATDAYITAQDIDFPSDDVTIDLPQFPATFYVDVDNDGVKDLIAAPNAPNASENYKVGWLYKNMNANNNPDFTFQQNNFMTDKMIDRGFKAHPAFFDYNNDGLKDLIVGNYGFYAPLGNSLSKLALYENIGTGNEPRYELVNDDYLGMGDLGLNDLNPTIGDVDNDGDIDLLIGEEKGHVYYYENIAGANNTPSFAAVSPQHWGVDFGKSSAPQILDIDEDGQNELIMGFHIGWIKYYEINENTIDLVTDYLGEVDMRAVGLPTAYSTPLFLKTNQGYVLYSGTEQGALFKYTNISNNLGGIFTLETSNYADLFIGKYTSIDAADIDGDGLYEFVVGNARGGINIFNTNTLTSTEDPITINLEINMSPNPVNNIVNIQTNYQGAFNIKIYDAIGQVILEKNNTFERSLDVSKLANALYFVEIEANNSSSVKKTVKKIIKH